jgi:Predicted phosphoribosyltransferases
MRFQDRTEAGKRLAEALAKHRNQEGIVYALPRGGVVLGAEIAQALRMPLDLIIPRKIGHPTNPEYAICAVAENGEMVCNEREASQVDPAWLRKVFIRERKEALRRRRLYLGSREPTSAAGKSAILVDDGMATGLTMQAAIRDARTRKPARIIVAIPVAPTDTAQQLAREVDEVVALEMTDFHLGAVGAYYADFPQVTDEEVINLLRVANPNQG